MILSRFYSGNRLVLYLSKPLGRTSNELSFCQERQKETPFLIRITGMKKVSCMFRPSPLEDVWASLRSKPPVNGVTSFFSEESFNKVVGCKTFYDRFLEKANELYVRKSAAGDQSAATSGSDYELNKQKKNLLDNTRSSNERLGELEERYDGGDEISAHSRKFQFRLPLPPRKSCLTCVQHKRYTELFQKYYLCSSQYLKATEQKELLELQNLQSLIAAEQEEFQRLLEEAARKTPDHYQYMHAEAGRYVEEKLAGKRKRVDEYPQYYSAFDSVPLTLHNHELENPPVLMYGRPLMELGQVPDVILPNLKAPVKPHVSRDYNKVSKRFPASKSKSENHLADCSFDQNAEHLAKNWQCKVVLSASVLKCLIDNHGPHFTRGWEIPVTVKEYEINDNTERKMLKVVYLDKPLCPKTVTSREKSVLYHKYALRALVSNRQPMEKDLSKKEYKNTGEALKQDDPFNDSEDLNIEDLESFGTNKSKLKKIPGELVHPYQRKHRRKAKTKNKPDTSETDIFDVDTLDITDLESFGDKKQKLTQTSLSGIRDIESHMDVCEDIHSEASDKIISECILSNEKSIDMDSNAVCEIPDDITEEHRDMDINYSSNTDPVPDNISRKEPTPLIDSKEEKENSSNCSLKQDVDSVVDSQSVKMEEVDLSSAVSGVQVHSSDHEISPDIQIDSESSSVLCQNINQNEEADTISLSSSVEDDGLKQGKNKRKRENSKDNDAPTQNKDTLQSTHTMNTRSRKKSLLPETKISAKQNLVVKQENLVAKNEDKIIECIPRRSLRNRKTDSSSSDKVDSPFKKETKNIKKTSQNVMIDDEDDKIETTSQNVTIEKENLIKITAQNVIENEHESTSDSDSGDALMIDIPDSPAVKAIEKKDKSIKKEERSDAPISTSSVRSVCTRGQSKKVVKTEENNLIESPMSPESNKIEEKNSGTPQTKKSHRSCTMTTGNNSEMNSTVDKDISIKSKEPQKVCLEIADILSPDPVSVGGAQDVVKESDKFGKSEPTKIIAWDSENNDGAVMWDHSIVQPESVNINTSEELSETFTGMADSGEQEEEELTKLPDQLNEKCVQNITGNIQKKEITPLDSILQMQDTLITPKITTYTENTSSEYEIGQTENYEEINQDNPLKELETDADACKDMKNGNVSYHQWFINGIPLIIRCHYHGTMKSDKQTYNTNIFPKLEYHSLYGVEKCTPSETSREWISTYITPNSRCLRARIHAFTSELLLLEELDLLKIQQNKSVYNPKYGFALLNKIITKVVQLPVGKYLFGHLPKDPHCFIKNSVQENRRGVYDLHKAHHSIMNKDSCREPFQWIALDPTVFLHHHRKAGRIPVTFEPKAFVPPKMFYGKKQTKKKKKGKNKKKTV